MKQDILPDSLLTSYQVGGILQVNPSSVNKWVKDGRIPAFRTPGGHRRIRAVDLISFLHNHQMPVPRLLAGASKRRLLVIDDDSKHLETLERVLKPHTDRVELSMVTNGIDALVAIGSFKPHIVMLDVSMPGLSGNEVCQRLKNNPETAATRIIMISAQLTPDSEKQAQEAGADLCLSKPVDISIIMAELEATAQLHY